jgi:hypothetical protein
MSIKEVNKTLVPGDLSPEMLEEAIEKIIDLRAARHMVVAEPIMKLTLVCSKEEKEAAKNSINFHKYKIRIRLQSCLDKWAWFLTDGTHIVYSEGP